MGKSQRRLRSYMTSLLIVVFLISIFANDWGDFFLGFFAGFHEMDVEQAKVEFGELSRIVSATTLVLVGFFIFFVIQKMRRKITDPIEQIADGMKEVSRGNLEITVPTDGDFEFEEMQQTFNHMVEDLKSAREEKELREQRNQQLYAGIAHDLKTPMTMIMGYAKTLQEKECLAEEKERYLQTIIDQTEQANRLLDSMLIYAKLENQAYCMKKEKNDLAECLRTCVAAYYPTMEDAGIQIKLEIPETMVEYEFDELEMKRVFLNLLTNMVKHNPPETRCFVKLTEDSPFSKEERRISVVIADNGPKISQELRENIFDAFAVGDSSRNTKNGSGLGLALCKKIVERHEGEIEYVEDWQEDYKGFVIQLGKKM